MTHRTFQLTDEAARALLAAYHATSDGAYRTRLQAVRLYGLGYTPSQIADISGCPRSTLLLWCRSFSRGGIAALDDHRVGGNSAKLRRDQLADLSGKLRQYTPRSLFGSQAATTDGQAWTVADLRRAVQEWYGVTYQSVVSYYSLFHRCDYSYDQPTKVFKSRNEAAVMEFETQIEKNSSTVRKPRQRR
jgi:transposase